MRCRSSPSLDGQEAALFCCRNGDSLSFCDGMCGCFKMYALFVQTSRYNVLAILLYFSVRIQFQSRQWTPRQDPLLRNEQGRANSGVTTVFVGGVQGEALFSKSLVTPVSRTDENLRPNFVGSRDTSHRLTNAALNTILPHKQNKMSL